MTEPDPESPPKGPIATMGRSISPLSRAVLTKTLNNTSSPPQSPQSQLTIDGVKICSTPRKLVRSLQEPTYSNSRDSIRRRLALDEVEQNTELATYGTTCSHNLMGAVNARSNTEKMGMRDTGNSVDDSEVILGSSESVSTSDDLPGNCAAEVSSRACEEKNVVSRKSTWRVMFQKTTLGLTIALLLLAAILSYMRIDDEEIYLLLLAAILSYICNLGSANQNSEQITVCIGASFWFQRPQSQLTIDGEKMCSTPRKLVRSLQEPIYSNSRDSTHRSPALDEVEQNTKVATSIIAITESDHSAPEPPPKGSITSMGRSISPLLRREPANLNDAGNRHSAMKALKSYVRDLDSKAIPHFLAEVSETKEPGSSPGECTISHYEVLARVHGPKIVPQIDSIMSTIMRTLSSSAGSFPVHQACSRVVPVIARYAIEPSTPGEEKTRIIHSLYKPLCDALMCLQESVSSGDALCLKAVVQADNWRFASDAMVNEICLKVASALEEKATQTNYHMDLVMALVKHNTLIAEAYAKSFLRSGLGILSTDITESNTLKRLLAIQMINSLLHCVDSRSISLELYKVFDAMEKCKTDQFQFVRFAARETLQIAKVIASQKGFDRRNGKSTPGATETDLQQHMNDEQREAFAGFGQSRAASEGRRSNTSTTTQRPQSQLTIDGLKICSTPRKRVRSLQEPTYSNSRDSIHRSLAFDEVEQNRKVATSVIAITESDHSAAEPPQKAPITTMGRRISPLLWQELANLDDAGSCHSPMKSFKSYVRELDSKAIPHFPAEVSEVKEPGLPPGECTMTHYEVLARVDGPKIVPQIDSIMSTIIRTLSSSAGSFPVHQACSRVVPAIVRYAIEPSTPDEEKTRIIHSLCKPLCDALMDLQESVSSGAALCLKAIVQADNWRFASDAMVNEICLKVASALEEKVTQKNNHMNLVTALVKCNTLITDAYARSFLRSGLGILSTGITKSNTQKRLSAIQMINSLLHCVDSRSIYSELDKVFDAMAKCRTDQFQCVRVAAWETLQIAKAIASQKGFVRRNGKSTPGATESDLLRHMNDGQTEVFAGFGHSRAASEGRRSNTSSSLQRPQITEQITIDGLKSSTPRKLVRSLQEPTYWNSGDSIRRSPALDEVEQNTKVATSIIAIMESDHSAPDPPQKGSITAIGRRISPLLRQELANLYDAGSCHSPMKALKSSIRDLDSKANPHFLAEISEAKEPGSSPGECTISHYEVLARVDGPKIVPQIDSIMSTIMRTLSSSAGSFPVHQACSRVVPAIARYAIEPSTPGEEKTRIIHSLYKPLCDALMGLQESVSSGAALCLKAVVQADNWRFASDAMANEICRKVASALEVKVTQTNYHMDLVTALVKHNTLIADAYARSFLRSGLGILSTGITESNTQKRLSAIEMINSLLHCVDPRSIYSELDKVIDAMAKCRTDQFLFGRIAVWETLNIAKAIASQKGFDMRNGKSSLGATETDLEQHVNDEQREAFAGFGQSRAASEGRRSNTSSPPQRPQSQLSIDGVKRCSTPRKLGRSLQEPTYWNSRDWIRRSPALDESVSSTYGTAYSHDSMSDVDARSIEKMGMRHDSEVTLGSSESVTSPANCPRKVSCRACEERNSRKRTWRVMLRKTLIIALPLLAAIVSYVRIDDEEIYLIPPT